MKKLFRLSVFFVSYTPLWLSIAYIDLMNVFYHKTPSPWTEIISVVCICIAYLISVPNMVLTMRKLGKENSEQLQIKSVSEQKTASLEYMLSFVLPMFAFEFTQGEALHRAAADQGAWLQPRPVRLSPRGGGNPRPNGPDSEVSGGARLAERGD